MSAPRRITGELRRRRRREKRRSGSQLVETVVAAVELDREERRRRWNALIDLVQYGGAPVDGWHSSEELGEDNDQEEDRATPG